MITRRKFIQGTSAAAIAGLMLPKSLLAFENNKMIGIQLYTIRDLVNADLKGTLKKLAKIGYRTIEAAGYGNRMFYGMPATEYKNFVTDLGLIPLSSHAGVTLENAQQVIDDHAEAGITYLVVPSIPKEKRQLLDDYLKLSDEFNQIGELCKKAGLTFGYHNHAFEFDLMNGRKPYDVLLSQTEAELVTMQLDTYWMVYGGSNPVEYFNNFPGRFKLWHVKDMDKTEKRESTEIGSGIIDFKELFTMQEKAGLEYYFVEQEEFKMDTIKSITQSFNYLNSI
jgi:sugar phosphate isomerase/epimerase